MCKFLRMIPVLVLACALLSVSAFAADDHACSITDGEYIYYFVPIPDSDDWTFSVYCRVCGNLIVPENKFTVPIDSLLSYVSTALLGGNSVSVDGSEIMRLCEHILNYDFVVAWLDGVHYCCCDVCNICVLGDYVLGQTLSSHTDSDCAVCAYVEQMGASVSGSNIRFMSLSDFSASLDSSISISTIIDDTASIFSGYLDMAAVTASTVSEHPVLLVAFALPLIGISVVLFRRIRR